MHQNSVMCLRKQELAKSTRGFSARGSRVIRCDECLLPKNNCLCSQKPVPAGDCAVVMLMYKGEYYKPTNTGRLIADVVKNNHAFVWHRTDPQKPLLNLLNNKDYQPYIVFPHEYALNEPCVSEVNHEEKRKPLFVFLDGTWREAKKMFTKSEYLRGIPVLSIPTNQESEYKLREASHGFQQCTAEIAIDILKLAGETQCADNLKTYFHYFRYHYIKGKPHIDDIPHPKEN